MNVAEQIGANIRYCRKRAKLSQEDLSFRAGLHRTAVSQLERALRVPGADTLVKLGGAMGIDPGDLLDGIVWEPGDVRLGHFIAQEVPGLGIARQRFEVERPDGS